MHSIGAVDGVEVLGQHVVGLIALATALIILSVLEKRRGTRVVYYKFGFLLYRRSMLGIAAFRRNEPHICG